MSKRALIKETKVKQIIQEELFYRQVLEEGIWDNVKSGVSKMKSKVSSLLGDEMISNITGMMKQFDKKPEKLEQIFSVIKNAEKQTGEKIEGPALDAAIAIGNIDAKQVNNDLSSDFKGPVHDKAEKLTSESATYNKTLKSLNEKIIQNNKEQLNEAGVVGAVGLGLAGFGGLVMLFKGLSKLFSWLGFEKTSALFKKIYKALHHFEERTLDLIIPDRMSYTVYKVLFSKFGMRWRGDAKNPLEFEEYKKNEAKVKTKVEKLIYSAALIYLAWDGISYAVNAGTTILGFTEGAASAIKTLEIGQAGANIGDIMDLGSDVADVTDDAELIDDEFSFSPSQGTA